MTSVSDSTSVRRRPGGVTAVAVIAATLGGLGLVVAFWMLVMTLVGTQAQANMYSQMGTMPPEQQAAYRDMMADTQKIAEAWKPVTLIVCLFSAITSAGLLIGSIGCLRDRSTGRSLLVKFLLASILVEAIWLAVMIPMQMQTIEATQSNMARMMEAGSTDGKPTPAGAKEAIQAMTRIMMYFSIAVACIWALSKVMFFGISVRYLRRPHVLAFYQGAAPIDVVPLG